MARDGYNQHSINCTGCIYFIESDYRRKTGRYLKTHCMAGFKCGDCKGKVSKIGKLKVLVIPYRTFKERIRLTNEHLSKYYIENMGNCLYMVRRK